MKTTQLMIESDVSLRKAQVRRTVEMYILLQTENEKAGS